MPPMPGVYAWWAQRRSVPDVAGPAHPTEPGVELLYVGISPQAESGQRTMHDRLKKDHARRTQKSTLRRRALAALLWEREGWTPTVTPHGRPRPTLDRDSESLLTAWMREHLVVTWAAHPRPWDVERDVIIRLRPPLNVEHNAAHPLYPVVRARRDAWIGAARAAGTL